MNHNAKNTQILEYLKKACSESVESQSKKHTIIESKRVTGMLVSHASFLAKASEMAVLRLTGDFVFAANPLETIPQRCPFLNSDYS